MAAEGRQGQAGLSAQAVVYKHLFDEIRSGRLPGGTHVAAETIARHLSVSRMPVREAIRQLASEGYMTMRSNRGAIVTELAPKDVAELYEMRAALEGFAAGLVAERIDAEGLHEAELSLQRLDRARSDVDWFVRAHDQFHDIFLRYCPRSRLVAEVVRVRTATEPCLRIVLRRSPTAIAATVEEHRKVLEAIGSGDRAQAESVMRGHILGTDILHLLGEGPAQPNAS
jgi:DNA-binding GntR family transcriptional regulator